MREHGTIRIVVPEEWKFRASPVHEARRMAEEAGGTLGEMKASEDFDAVDNATVYTFQMEREVPES